MKLQYACKAMGCNHHFLSEVPWDFCPDCQDRSPSQNTKLNMPISMAVAPEGLVDRMTSNEDRNAHYFKDVTYLTTVDVYRILDLFEVTQPCLAHLVKKALCAGERGHKDYLQDLIDIRDSIERAIDMEMEDQMIAQRKELNRKPGG